MNQDPNPESRIPNPESRIPNPETYNAFREASLRARCARCRELAARAASRVCGSAVTDPAYESLEKHRAVGTTTRLKHSKSSSNDWFRVFPNERFGELFAEVFRVLKPDTHFYLFCDAETMFIAKPEAEQAGFKFWKPLVWDKKTIGMGYHYRARYEFILFFEKGKRRLKDLGVADIITEPRIHRGYPAEKPSGSPRSSSAKARSQATSSPIRSWDPAVSALQH